MSKTLTLIDALEQRLALIVGVAAVAFSAADPTALTPKWAAIIAAVVAVSHVLAPAAPVAAPVKSPNLLDALVTEVEASSGGVPSEAVAPSPAPQTSVTPDVIPGQ